MQAAQSKIAADVLGFYPCESAQRASAEGYLATQFQAHDKVARTLVTEMRKAVLKPLQRHVQLMQKVVDLSEKRKRKKMDYDAYRRKLEHAVAKKDVDEAVLKRKRDKALHSRTVFANLDTQLREHLEYYNECRSVMLNKLLADMTTLQCTFFADLQTRVGEPAKTLSEEFHAAAEASSGCDLESIALALEDLYDHAHETSNLEDPSTLPPPPPASSPGASPLPSPRGSPSKRDYSLPPLSVSAPPAIKASDVGDTGISAPIIIQTHPNPSPFPFSVPFATMHAEMAPGAPPKNTQLLEANDPGAIEPYYVVAAYDYEPSDPSTELSFSQGQYIQILTAEEDGWVYGELDGRQGYLPLSFTVPYEAEGYVVYDTLPGS